MGYVRALLLICFGMGLFVQVAAQAAAMPQPAKANAMDCTEMVQVVPGHMEAEGRPSEEGMPCSEMALDCLIALNCLPPLALADAPSAPSPLVKMAVTYPLSIGVRLDHRALRPESPPPQFTLAS